MEFLRIYFTRLRGLFRREALLQDSEEEMRVHLDMIIQSNLNKGMNPKDARAAALKSFGNLAATADKASDIRVATFFDSLRQDLIYGIRMSLKAPSFTILAVTTLALGIGAVTTLFSMVLVVLFNQFPYPEHNRLYYAVQNFPKTNVERQIAWSGREFEDLNQVKSIERIALVEGVSRNLTGAQEPERLRAGKVSGEFFTLLGISPIKGRTITEQDLGPTHNATETVANTKQEITEPPPESYKDRVLVISHDLWQRRFGGENVIGHKIDLDNEPYMIIGIMPPNFHYEDQKAWFPYNYYLNKQPRNERVSTLMIRLKRDNSQKQAEAELEVIARKQDKEFAGIHPEYASRKILLNTFSYYYYRHVNGPLTLLIIAVGLLLLLACANIANMLSARATDRSKEIAIRITMGGGRSRIIRQLLTESLILSMFGGILGIILAYAGIKGIVAIIPEETIPQHISITINGTVLLFTLIVLVTSTLLFGLRPAFKTTQIDLHTKLKEVTQVVSLGRKHLRGLNLLVSFQIAISLLLLIGAGLTVRNIVRLINANTGMNTENILSMRLNISPVKSENGKNMAAIFHELSNRIGTIPNIKSVGVASHIPFEQRQDMLFTAESSNISIDKQTQEIDMRAINIDYFRTLGIKIVNGDNFTVDDKKDTNRVTIINQTMARLFWPGENPIGKRIKSGKADSKSSWYTIRGVVNDSTQINIDDPIKPEAYFAMNQTAQFFRRMNILVKTSGDPTSVASAITNAIRSYDKNQAVYQVQTMDEWRKSKFSIQNFTMILLIIFAAISIILASVGIYGVVSYATAQRKREVGIRMALGAQQYGLLRTILQKELVPIIAGLGIGLGSSLILLKLMSNYIVGIIMVDPIIIIFSIIILSLIALLACLIPSLRLLKIKPVAALRYE